MSMTLTLVALRDEEIERVVAEPGLALDILLPEDDEPSDIAAVDLDKAWHGIHYLLTGGAWNGEPPLNALVAGGEELVDRDEEWGYGPPRAFRSAETVTFGDALDALSNDELSSRFDPVDMLAKEIYPEIWDRDPEDDDTLAYLMENVDELRQFIRRAAAERQGLLIAIV